jgi:protein-tyrosine kinase
MNSIEKIVDRLMQSGTNTGGSVRRDSSVEFQRSRGPEAAAIAPHEQQVIRGSDVVQIDLALLKSLGMLTPGNSRSLIAEEYRAIKRPLLKNAFKQDRESDKFLNLIMVTSSIPGEGKSFTSVNLAMSIAMEMDHTVLLVEGDVAKPVLAKYLGLSGRQRGLVDYLADEKLTLDELLVRTNVPKLSILSAGRAHPQATELLSSQHMRRLTQELAQRYPDRIVIFDSPPLLLSSEAVVLSTLVGQIVMVVESGKTPQRIVKDALSLLGHDKIVGIVLNKSLGSSSKGFGYGSYDSQGYGRD